MCLLYANRIFHVHIKRLASTVNLQGLHTICPDYIFFVDNIMLHKYLPKEQINEFYFLSVMSAVAGFATLTNIHRRCLKLKTFYAVNKFLF